LPITHVLTNKLSAWKLTFLTSWGRFQRRFDNILEEMNRHGTLIDQEANAHNIAEARQQREDIKIWREESLERIRVFEEEQAAKQYNFISSWLRVDDSEQMDLLNLVSAEGAKYPGTCSWALKHPKIASWLRPTSNAPFLWLQGTAGCGKSVLLAQLINFQKINNQAIIHHFIHQSYALSTAYEHILKSVLLQLLRNENELAAHVYQEYVLGKKPPTTHALEQILKSLFMATSHGPRKIQYIWIIIDGVDACEPEKQTNLVSLMNQILSKCSSPNGTICKVLFSSRSLPSNRLAKDKIVSLTEERDLLDTAIRAYVSQRLRAMHTIFQQLHLGSPDIDKIEHAIISKADGM